MLVIDFNKVQNIIKSLLIVLFDRVYIFTLPVDAFVFNLIHLVVLEPPNNLKKGWINFTIQLEPLISICCLLSLLILNVYFIY